MRMRAFVPSCYNNPQAAYSFSKVLWFCQLYPRESSLLGMEKENIPPTKKAKVSLSLKKSRKPRFQPVSEDKLKGMTVPYVPKNTEQSSKWAMTNFREWFDSYNERNAENTCPEEVLSPSCRSDVLCKWLCVFVTETRSKFGKPYPPKTIMSLLAGILRHMRHSNPDYPNFLSKESTSFVSFQVTLDNLFKILRSDGVGAHSGQTEGISSEEENTLWLSGVMNSVSPKGLLRCKFFYVGKSFCLRGGEEHRCLTLSQFTRLHKPDRYVYSEKSSKNRQGGLYQAKMDHKTVTVYLLDLYISKFPKGAVDNDLFYCKPMASAPLDASCPWYFNVPIGKNTLSKMVADMCAEAGLSGKKTNHSLRVSGTSCLFEAGVPEKLIQQRTGHRTLESLRMYERVTDKQQLAVSKVLTGEKNTYEDAERDIENSVFEGAEKVRPISTNCNITSQSSLMPSSAGVQYNNCTFYGAPGVPSIPQPLPPMYAVYSPFQHSSYESYSSYQRPRYRESRLDPDDSGQMYRL